MSDEIAFLAAIRAAPGDDLTKLVYADWLDEHDDPRGRLVRAEVALANEILAVYGALDRELPELSRTWEFTKQFDPYTAVTLASLTGDTGPSEEMVRLARRLKIGVTADLQGALDALAKLPRKLGTYESLTSAVKKARQIHAAGGLVTIEPLSSLELAERDPRNRIVRTAALMSVAASEVVNAGGMIEQEWWDAIRPTYRVIVHALTPRKPDVPRRDEDDTHDSGWVGTVTPDDLGWNEYDRMAKQFGEAFVGPVSDESAGAAKHNDSESDHEIDQLYCEYNHASLIAAANRTPVVSLQTYSAAKAVEMLDSFKPWGGLLTLTR